MPITSKWLIQDRVIYTYITDIDLDDLAIMTTEMNGYLTYTKYSHIHQIIDLSHIGRHPTNLPKLKQTLDYWQNPKLGWITPIGIKSQVVAFLGQVLSQATRTNFRPCDTLQDALQLLYQIEPDLKNLPLLPLEDINKMG